MRSFTQSVGVSTPPDVITVSSSKYNAQTVAITRICGLSTTTVIVTSAKEYNMTIIGMVMRLCRVCNKHTVHKIVIAKVDGNEIVLKLCDNCVERRKRESIKD